MTHEGEHTTPPAPTARRATRHPAFGHLARAGLRLPPRPDNTITHAGTLPLFPHQREAVEQLSPLLDQWGGAVLADAVGLGKTFVALALLSAYDSADVIAPAGLVAMWRAAIARVNITPVPGVHSLHRFSRRDTPSAAETVQQRSPRHLVVIDEAHHLRNPATRRYEQVAHWCRSATVLLLTATPVHNRRRDLQQLLALFLGTRAGSLTPAAAAQFVVRRLDTGVTSGVTSGVASHGAPNGGPSQERRPEPIAHPATPVTDSPSVTGALTSLAAPIPTRAGRAAGALVTLGLIRAWCSSAAACLTVLRRRRARASVLADALAMGRWPSAAELRTWTVSDDTVQLGFTALLTAQPEGEGDASAMAAARAQIARHASGLDTLAAAVRRDGARTDRERVELLRRVRTQHRGTPVVAFTQFAETVRALGRIMRWDAGVATLTAQRGHVAGGPLTRDEILRRFAPRAHRVPPPAPHERILLLVTTDLLAEGVNLQDAGVVVHLDLPWTAAAIAQREGRLTRIGSEHAVVHVYSLAPPGGGGSLLQLAERLRRKARAAAMTLNVDVPPPPVPRLVALPTARSPLQQILREWLVDTAPAEHGDQAHTTQRTRLVLPHARAGWLAAVHTQPNRTELIGGWFTHRATRTQPTSEPGLLLPLVRAAHAHGTTAPSPSHHRTAADATRTPRTVGRLEEIAQRACTRFARQQSTAALANPVRSVQQQSLRQLRQRLYRASLRERQGLASVASALAARLRATRGIGAEVALGQRLVELEARPTDEWMHGLLDVLAPTSASSDAWEPPGAPTGVEPRLAALLLLVP